MQILVKLILLLGSHAWSIVHSIRSIGINQPLAHVLYGYGTSCVYMCVCVCVCVSVTMLYSSYICLYVQIRV